MLAFLMQFLIHMFELAWVFIGIFGMLQLLLALVMPIKWKWIAILLIPALYLTLAGYCFLASTLHLSDDFFAAYMSGMYFVAGFIFSLPFSLLGYFLQKLKVPAVEQEDTND